MSWRTVVITNRCKLDLKMGYMLVRGEETKKIYLDEISMLIIENPAVSLTGCLLEALVSQKIRVIFCDGKRSPMAELAPLYGSHDSSRKIRAQINWGDSIKEIVWTEIVAEKIRKQAEFLNELGKMRESTMLKEYIGAIELNDATNREGHAAKVYFNAVFGMDFTRSEENVTNAALNYGYAIILSAFNREVTACGYLTQLGLFHDNMFNHFNLSCDLMEPFRISVDRMVYSASFQKFETEEKHFMWNILNQEVFIDNTRQTLSNAIKIYARSVFDALNDAEPAKIKFAQQLKQL